MGGICRSSIEINPPLKGRKFKNQKIFYKPSSDIRPSEGPLLPQTVHRFSRERITLKGLHVQKTIERSSNVCRSSGKRITSKRLHVWKTIERSSHDRFFQLFSRDRSFMFGRPLAGLPKNKRPSTCLEELKKPHLQDLPKLEHYLQVYWAKVLSHALCIPLRFRRLSIGLSEIDIFL